MNEQTGGEEATVDRHGLAEVQADERTADAATAVAGKGFAICAGALEPSRIAHLRDEVARVFEQARSVPNGAVARGPERWYVEVHPERIDGFVDIAAHPWVEGVAEAILGPDYRIVEFGFDIPFPGAELQPWHRDFPMPPETANDRRLTSLAFNIPLVTITDEMGRFEIVPGTQYDLDDDFAQRQFPPSARSADYASRSVELELAEGDISARSALAIHRGRPNRSEQWRPMLVIGFDDPTAENSAHHDLTMSRSFWDGLPDNLRRRFDCPVVEQLAPLEQRHLIDGLLEPAESD